MSPKPIAFSREVVLAAAVDVVRRHGLESLTARAVADRLRASVAPVYSAFRSMAELERAVLEEARRLMDERTRLSYTDIPFLNIGVGILTFARDEPRLFSALFHTRPRFAGILTSFHASVLARMQADEFLRLLPQAQLERLLDSIWHYTLGLGTALVFGHDAGRRDEDLIRPLRDMGNILMLAEAEGFADAESPANEKAWKRAFEAWGIPLAKLKKPQVPPGPERLAEKASRRPAMGTADAKHGGRRRSARIITTKENQR